MAFRGATGVCIDSKVSMSTSTSVGASAPAQWVLPEAVWGLLLGRAPEWWRGATVNKLLVTPSLPSHRKPEPLKYLNRKIDINATSRKKGCSIGGVVGEPIISYAALFPHLRLQGLYRVQQQNKVTLLSEKPSVNNPQPQKRCPTALIQIVKWTA